MSISTTDSESWIGGVLVDDVDHRLGTIEEVYFDEQTGRAQWLVIRRGRFAARHTFVPLAHARRTPAGIRTHYDRRQIESAPRIDPADDLPEQRLHALYDHYGLPYDALVETDGPDGPSPRELVLSWLT